MVWVVGLNMISKIRLLEYISSQIIENKKVIRDVFLLSSRDTF